jgi:hypothetical protein
VTEPNDRYNHNATSRAVKARIDIRDMASEFIAHEGLDQPADTLPRDRRQRDLRGRDERTSCA